MNLFRQHAQPKDEHPRQEEWDELKRRAKEQGLLQNDGTFADPPRGGCALFSPTAYLPTAEQAIRALAEMFALPETLNWTSREEEEGTH